MAEAKTATESKKESDSVTEGDAVENDSYSFYTIGGTGEDVGIYDTFSTFKNTLDNARKAKTKKEIPNQGHKDIDLATVWLEKYQKKKKIKVYYGGQCTKLRKECCYSMLDEYHQTKYVDSDGPYRSFAMGVLIHKPDDQ